jgi:hypothetical protein
LRADAVTAVDEFMSERVDVFAESREGREAADVDTPNPFILQAAIVGLVVVDEEYEPFDAEYGAGSLVVAAGRTGFAVEELAKAVERYEEAAFGWYAE